jgi:hypothetical protein
VYVNIFYTLLVVEVEIIDDTEGSETKEEVKFV